MQEIITGLEKTFNLYKPPNRIGDIIDYKDNSYLIIGIERVRFVAKKLKVTYTCQNLNVPHVLRPEVQPFDNYTEFYVKIDTKKHFEQDWSYASDDLVRLGRVFGHENHYYRWLMYTDLEFEFTTLKVSGLAQLVYPVTRRTLMEHKRKKLDLVLIR